MSPKAAKGSMGKPASADMGAVMIKTMLNNDTIKITADPNREVDIYIHPIIGLFPDA